MKCPNCDGKGEIDDKPEGGSTAGGIATLVCIAILVFFMAGFLRECSHMHLGGGMCGLIGIEAVVPLSLLWLFRKIR